MEARVDDALVNRRGRGPSSGLHNPLPSDWSNACYFLPADSIIRYYSKMVRYAECFYVVEHVLLLWGVRLNVQEMCSRSCRQGLAKAGCEWSPPPMSSLTHIGSLYTQILNHPQIE